MITGQLTYLFVEVDETLRAVDIVEGCKARNGPVDGHGVGPELTPACQHQPVRVRAGNEDAFVSGDIAEVTQLVPEICHAVRLFGSSKKLMVKI